MRFSQMPTDSSIHLALLPV